MTGKSRKPQTSRQTTLVRQRTDWQDGTSKWAIMHGAQPKYDSLPKNPPPISPMTPPTATND